MERATRNILQESWTAYCRHWGPLTGAYVLVFLVSQTGIGLFFMGPFYTGMCAMALAAVRGREVSFDTLFDAFDNVVPSLLAGLILTLLAVVPPLIIMGLAFSAAFSMALAGPVDPLQLWLLSTFAPVLALLPLCAVVLLYTPTFFLLSDGETRWGAAMKTSERMVRDEWTSWTGLWVVLGLAHLFSVLLCCVPSFFVTPWMVVALALRYERQRGAISGPATARAVPPSLPPTPPAH